MDRASYAAALAFLLGRIDYERAASPAYGEREFKLDRMHDLLARLGNPHRRLPVVHITGTKGKGSTAAMTAAMLTAAGYRTGLFSSPHLDRIEERLSIDGQPCPTEEFVALVERLRPVVAEMDAIAERAAEIGPTYFELTTALAWLHFVERAVDVAVLEVGMGGRLDSTNVCQPVVTVVTNISFDHTKQLGNTLALIAGEKAGILKPGVPAISGVLTDEPRQVIERVAREQGCRLVQLGRDFEYVYRAPLQVDRSALDDSTAMPRIDFNFRAEGQACQVEGLALGLLGQHQGANAALALAVWQELVRLGWRLPEEAVRRGLAEVRWPARIELVRRRPAIIVDSAHNVASITALLETLAESFAARRRVLIFATTRDKDLRGMLRLLLPAFETVVFTRYENNPRGVPPEELLALARELNIRESSLGTSPPEPIVAPTPAAAWAVVRDRLGPDDLLCITGSFFIAAELRTAVRG